MINNDALLGLAVTTAFLRSDFDNQTLVWEVEDADAWDTIADLAVDYIRWVGLDVTDVRIDKYTIAKCVWGKDSDELDEDLENIHQMNTLLDK